MHKKTIFLMFPIIKNSNDDDDDDGHNDNSNNNDDNNNNLLRILENVSCNTVYDLDCCTQ